jgi:hypothetical protein
MNNTLQRIPLTSVSTQTKNQSFIFTTPNFVSIKSRESKNLKTYSPTKSYSVENDLRNQTQRALHELLEIGLKDNWDGDDAKRINRSAYNNARAFVKQLPMAAASPDVSLTPDGDVSIEWVGGKDKRFGVTVKQDKLIYSGIFGDSRIKGSEPYHGDGMPPIILSIISSLSMRFSNVS